MKFQKKVLIVGTGKSGINAGKLLMKNVARPTNTI
jgi:UDP-N-acetylmuramoylalanine-D-glutamate ligase